MMRPGEISTGNAEGEETLRQKDRFRTDSGEHNQMHQRSNPKKENLSGKHTETGFFPVFFIR